MAYGHLLTLTRMVGTGPKGHLPGIDVVNTHQSDLARISEEHFVACADIYRAALRLPAARGTLEGTLLVHLCPPVA